MYIITHLLSSPLPPTHPLCIRTHPTIFLSPNSEASHILWIQFIIIIIIYLFIFFPSQNGAQLARHLEIDEYCYCYYYQTETMNLEKTTAGMPLCRYSEQKFRKKTETNRQNEDVHLHYFYFYWKCSFPHDIFRYQQTLELGILLRKTSLQVEIFILT